jgi:hypothetical protein
LNPAIYHPHPNPFPSRGRVYLASQGFIMIGDFVNSLFSPPLAGGDEGEGEEILTFDESINPVYFLSAAGLVSAVVSTAGFVSAVAAAGAFVFAAAFSCLALAFFSSFSLVALSSAS